MRVAVTGATGFVGSRFLAVKRQGLEKLAMSMTDRRMEDLDLSNIDVVVHLAGKAHEMAPIPEEIYFKINHELTCKLAEKARMQGVKHFIYVSSVKVYGDELTGVVDEEAPCHPTDPYGKSKFKAESSLSEFRSADFRVAIIRPPLVYGPGVKGNMLRLLELAEKNYPLPFGATGNQRSMVFLDNLVELIHRIIDRRADGLFIAGDAMPLSTDKLITLIRKAMDKSPGLITVPGFMRKMIQMYSPALYIRLFGSFVVDNTRTNQVLDFEPPYSPDEGISEMVDWYRKNKTYA